MGRGTAIIVFLGVLGSMAILPARVPADPIAPGDLLVYQAGDATDNTSDQGLPLYILDLNPSNPGAAPVQTWDISTEADPLYATKGPTGPANIGTISLSDNNSEISFTGWTTTSASPTSPIQSTQGIARGVGVINAAGVYSQPVTYNPATLTGFLANGSPTQDFTHTAYSADGANWFLGDSGGVYYNNGTAPIPTTLDTGGNPVGNFDTTSIKSFGGTIYSLHSVSNEITGDYTLSTVSPSSINSSTTGINYTLVVKPSAAEGVAQDDFTMLSSANNGVYDTLYVADGNTIFKYALISGTWTLEGGDQILAANFAGIAADPAPGGGVDLYVSIQHNIEAGPPNTVDEITDSSAFDAAFTPSTPEVLYTAPAGVAVYGVSLAPTVPEPVSLAFLPAATLLILTRRRRSM